LAVKNQIPPNVDILPMTKGFHCAVPVNYNEAFMSTLVNSFFTSSDTSASIDASGSKGSIEKEPNLSSENSQNSVIQKTIWQSTFNYSNSDIENLKIVDIKIANIKYLTVEIRNQSFFSNWKTEIEVPSTAIDMYFDHEIWDHNLKMSLMKWLEAHTQFIYNPENGSQNLIFQIDQI
jgi:hypothetical protein